MIASCCRRWGLERGGGSRRGAAGPCSEVSLQRGNAFSKDEFIIQPSPVAGSPQFRRAHVSP